MFRILTVLTALAAIGFGAAFLYGSGPVYLPVAAVVVAAVLILSGALPLIMRFLIGLYAIAFVGLAAIFLAAQSGLVPEAIAPFLPPPSASVIAAILVLAHYLVLFIPQVRTVVALTSPYFETRDVEELDLGFIGKYRLRESLTGLGLFGVIIAINVGQVYMNVIFSFWNNRFYTALQHKDVTRFWAELGFFAIVATIWIVTAVYETYLAQWLDIRWRRWMSLRYIERWMSDGVHYRMRLTGDEADNPDQRIQEDIAAFVTRTRGIYIQMFSALLNLYAFISILWGLSSSFPYSVGGFELSTIPGYLVWIALLLAIVATWGTHLIGRPLIRLNFRKEQVEADFRFSAARLREYSEQIALSDGEAVERRNLMARFRFVIDNWLALMGRQKKLTWFTAGYGQASVVLPFLVMAPAYFTNAAMKLGDLTQTAGAFARVQDSFSFFVDFYSTLAAYWAGVTRLTGFDAAIARAETHRVDGPKLRPAATAEVAARDLDLRLPDGRSLLADADVSFRKGERVLVTGPSGSGKTTLFRALAGIWPFGSGTISVPEGETVMLLPQQPYLPLGTLRAALCYPADEHAYDERAIVTALEKVGLAPLVPRLDQVEPWTNALSGGEKQRVALVRAILRQPDWLFLDEATSALDETAEAAMYEAIAATLPRTTVISIGHRRSLAALHDRRVAVTPGPAGASLADAPLDSFGVIPAAEDADASGR